MRVAGFGDGVAVFVDDAKEEIYKETLKPSEIEVKPFDAGSPVVNPDMLIPGTDKKWGDQYSNAKAQIHAATSQKFYNTYRFVELGERDIDPEDMISLDIDDHDLFIKIARELSTPLWVKSATNSKKKVESKKDMEKRTELPSPNIADAIHMTSCIDGGFAGLFL